MKNQKNAPLQKLTSALFIASLSMATTVNPGVVLQSPLASEITISVIGAAPAVAAEENITDEPEDPDSPVIPQYSTVNNNSFIAIKYPPKTTQTVSSGMWIFISAYSSTVDQTDDSPCITASGFNVCENGLETPVIAANFLPLGTKVKFPTLFGDKVFVVEDRMNKRYYYKADIWMETREQALQFGVKNAPVEILKEI